MSYERAKKSKRNVAEMSFEYPDRWSSVTNECGVTTHTAIASPPAANAGTVTITFLDSRDPQVHMECPVGAKVIETDGRVFIDV